MRMRRPSKGGFLALWLLMALGAPLGVPAETKVILAEGTYTMGDGESPTFAEVKVLQKAKRIALEQAGTYVESYTKVRNLAVTTEEIQTIAGGILQIEILEQTRRLVENGLQFSVKIKATVATDAMEELVQRIRGKDSAEEYKKLQAEYDRLNQSLTSTKFPSGRDSRTTSYKQLRSKYHFSISKGTPQSSILWGDALFPLFLTSGSYAPGALGMVMPPETTKGFLYGLVREVRTIYSSNNKSVSSSASYDQTGRFVASTFQSDRETQGRSTVTYDADGYVNLVKEETNPPDLLLCKGRKTEEEKCRSSYIADTYNHRGDKIESIYQSHGGLMYRWEFKYDLSGNLVEEIHYAVDGSVDARFVSTYESSWHEIKQTMYRAERANGFKQEVHAEAFSHLDKSGRTILEEYNNPTLGFKVIAKYFYDDAGTLSRVEEVETFADLPPFIHPPTPRVKRVFDKEGREIESVSYSKEGTVQSHGFSSFDSEGRLTAITVQDGNQTRERLRIHYDPRGNITKVSMPPESVVISYDGTGNPKGVVAYGKDGAAVMKLRIGREFDSRGNWVRETGFKVGSGGTTGDVVYLISRTIGYYSEH